MRLFGYRTVPWTWLWVWKLLLKRGEEYVTGPVLELDCSCNVYRTWSFLRLMKWVFWASVTKRADTRFKNLRYRGCCSSCCQWKVLLCVCVCVCVLCVCVCACKNLAGVKIIVPQSALYRSGEHLWDAVQHLQLRFGVVQWSLCCVPNNGVSSV